MHTPQPLERRRKRPRPIARLAFVRVLDATVLVVDVAPWVMRDPFEADLMVSAIQLSYRRAVVLHATEPCGCREIYGRPELVRAIEAMPPHALRWTVVALDFSRVTRS